MIEIREYIDAEGRSLYGRWFNRLNAQAAAKVATALVRMEQGNLSSVKGVGSGVFESRLAQVYQAERRPFGIWRDLL